ncbi:Mitochondrial uncoupling protein 3 [Hibiscus syriacus]|uniref:Mitochondrial uncoupling protein 3 n=1 Tax=Hibiscus syriacus TaxID=106335 RepID=A0A6A2YUJ3_HIBSY|nr:Mitochondrial uncoupling protein 3 [Hibiscus syriacus]
MEANVQGRDETPTHTGVKILMTSLSAMVAETSTFPIDLTKTRLQLHGESQLLASSTCRSTNAFRVATTIVRDQCVLGLYQGLSPAIIRHLFYTPIRIVGYENLRNLVSTDESLSLSSKAFVGGISGVIAQRAFLVNMGELACYDHAKRFVINNQISDDNIYAHTLASIMSGLAATTLSCPADVVKTRMMNQAVGKEGNLMYKSSYDCLVKTVKIEGLTALWKGFFPTWARLGPWQFVFWVSYEKFRQISGHSSF